MADITTI